MSLSTGVDDGRVLPGRGADADLVLVGGGHTHVQVLRRWMMEPVPGVRLTLVVDRPLAVYSGMVPGFVAGDYAAPELSIDVVPLARRAGARVILAAATRVDPVRRRIELDGRPPIAYDVASLDVGSSVRGLDVPGVREHALATRPIADFVQSIERATAVGDGDRIAVVGAGAAGMELAFTLEARLRAAGRQPKVSVVAASADVMVRYPESVKRRLRREAHERGIALHTGVRVDRVEKDAIVVDGEAVACDHAVWATGASPVALLGRSELPLDADGFVRVRDTLQVVDVDSLFAAGDCAALEGHAWVPKAGVYAVRQGPVLDANLRAALSGESLRSYHPQRDFLTLVNLGEGRALGAKWGAVAVGRAVWRLKDWIDRRFMTRFQVLSEDADLAPEFPDPEAMGMEPMACGGCAAKVGATVLDRALSRLDPPLDDARVLLGLARPDDAAAVSLPGGDVVLATVDAFRSFSDDPWLVGRVAAVNAVSDVLAKGGRPRHALALVTVPEEAPAREEESLFQVLAGVRAALDPLGISLVGGHTTSGEELFVGLTVTGELADGESLLPLDGARAGDALLLSRPLGTGVLWAADMQGRARGAWVASAIHGMIRTNAGAAAVARRFGARACTDVSGFGLAGHLSEMLRASDASARLTLSHVPAIDGAIELLTLGLRSHYHEQNADGRRGLALAPGVDANPRVELLFDPQTSGGLLMAVAEDEAERALDALHEAGDTGAALIGQVRPPRTDGVRVEVV